MGFSGSEHDSTPVFHSSKQLHVTGMKIAAGSAVYPVRAIASVEVYRKSANYLMEVLKAYGVGIVMIVLSFWLGSSMHAFTGKVSLLPILFVLLGVLTLLVSSYGVARYFLERKLHIGFQSGDNLDVVVMDDALVVQMRNAVEKAITYSHNQSIPGPSVADELGKLAELRYQGAISDADWERAKDLFLGKRPDAREQTVQQLRQLHDLHRSGVLSESEFNMKKWDILSRPERQGA